MQADMPVAIVQGTPVNEQQERQPQAQTSAVPVPIEMLRQANVPATGGTPFAAGADGILVVKTEPAWPYICFMMPFPFFCMGYWMSSTVWLTFDTNVRTLHVKSCPGYCYCCSTERALLSYSDIGNVDIMPTNMQVP